MPKTVRVGSQTFTFPDSMSEEQVKVQMQKHFATSTATPEPAAPPSRDFNEAHRNNVGLPGSAVDFAEASPVENATSFLTHGAARVASNLAGVATLPIDIGADVLSGGTVRRIGKGMAGEDAGLGKQLSTVIRHPIDAAKYGMQHPGVYMPDLVSSGLVNEVGEGMADRADTALGVRPNAITDTAKGAGQLTADVGMALEGGAKTLRRPGLPVEAPQVAAPVAAEIPPEAEALARQAGDAQAIAQPRTAGTWQDDVLQRFAKNADERAGVHEDAVKVASDLSPEQQGHVTSGRAAYIDPDGNVEMIDADEVRRLHESARPEESSAAAGGVPEAGLVPVSPQEIRAGNSEAGRPDRFAGRTPQDEAVTPFGAQPESVEGRGTQLAQTMLGDKPQATAIDDGGVQAFIDDLPTAQGTIEPRYSAAGPDDEALLGPERPPSGGDGRRGTFKEPPAAPPSPPRGPGEMAPPTDGPIATSRKPLVSNPLYDRAVPQIVDSIERQGPAGMEAATRMRSANRYGDQVAAPMIKAIDNATKTMPPENLTKVGQLVENWTNWTLDDPAQLVKATNGDTALAQAATTIRNTMQAIESQARGVVADFIPLEDYLPHIGKRPEGMPESVQNLVLRAGHESRNLTRSRGAASTMPEGKNLIAAIRGYIRGSTRYIGELKAFNAGDRFGLDAAYDRLAARATADGFDGDLIKRFGSKALGGGQTTDRVMNKIADTVIYTQSITKPIFAPLRHFQQIKNDVAMFGFGDTAAGFARTLQQRFGVSPEGARAVLESGALARDAAEDIAHSQTNGGMVSLLRKGANMANAPVRAVDQFKAQLTANAAARHFDEVTKVALGEPIPRFTRAAGDLRASSTIRQAAIDELHRAGVDVAKLSDPTVYKQGMLNYMWQAVQDAQKHTSALGSPAMSMSPWGRMLYTFQRPLAFQTDFVIHRVLQPALQGNVGPLVRYVIGSALAFTASEDAIKTIRGKETTTGHLIHGTLTGKEAAKDLGEAVAPHGLTGRSYMFNARNPNEEGFHAYIPEAETAMDTLLGHTGAIGATAGDVYHLLKGVQATDPDKRTKEFLRLEGHARTASELANMLRGQ